MTIIEQIEAEFEKEFDRVVLFNMEHIKDFYHTKITTLLEELAKECIDGGVNGMKGHSYAPDFYWTAYKTKRNEVISAFKKLGIKV